MAARVLKFVAAALAAAGVAASSAHAVPTLTAPYSSDYALTNLGGPTGVPSPLGGLTFLDGNTLLIGGGANTPGGSIYALGVTRDSGNHITGFSGAPTLFASAPFIDGGLVFNSASVLFYTGYPVNLISQLKPGSVTADRTDPAGVSSSVGTLQFVPTGFSGGGRAVVGSFNAGEWVSFELTPDGNGTYTLGSASPMSVTGGGPEGLVYVAGGNADFDVNSALVSQYSTNTVAVYALDAYGNPTGPGTAFVTGLNGAEGATVDPVTNDFLFSTFGSGNEIIRVSGFTVGADLPEPASLVLFGVGLLALAACRRG